MTATAELRPIAVSIAEAARMLAVSETHVRNLVHAGEIPVIPLGGRQVIPMRWLDAQVDAALARCTQVAS